MNKEQDDEVRAVALAAFLDRDVGARVPAAEFGGWLPFARVAVNRMDDASREKDDEDMTEKWTPGPWHVPHMADDNHSCECRAVTSECHAGAVCTIGIDNGRSIGDGGNDRPPLAEAKANARLIAAAPDLVEALEEWEEPNTCGCDTFECRDTCAPAKTRTALRKARGEQR